jgi:hypothetical protein
MTSPLATVRRESVQSGLEGTTSSVGQVGEAGTQLLFRGVENEKHAKDTKLESRPA